MEWGTSPSPFSHPLCFLLSLSLCTQHPSLMASNVERSLVGTNAVLPPPVPLWWQPMTRWVAVLHLPVHLHLPRILAPLVVHFGSMVSFSYPANFKDKKILMVLVRNCFISKIPHILPVCEGDKVFPIRIQVVFQAKVSGEGIIFDPMDLGDGFCSYSGGQSPVNPILQSGPTPPCVSPTPSHAHTKDKRKKHTTVTDVDLSYLQSVRGFVFLDRTLSHGCTMIPSLPSNNLFGPMRVDQSLNQNALKLTGMKAATSHDNDPSAYEESHLSHILGSDQLNISKREPNNLPLCQDNDLSVKERSHLLLTSKNNLTKTDKLSSVNASESHSIVSSVPCQDGKGKYPELVDKKNVECVDKKNVEASLHPAGQCVVNFGNLVASVPSKSERKKLSRYVNPPKVYRRRSSARVSVYVSSQEKAPIGAPMQESPGHPTKQVVGNLWEFRVEN